MTGEETPCGGACDALDVVQGNEGVIDQGMIEKAQVPQEESSQQGKRQKVAVFPRDSPECAGPIPLTLLTPMHRHT